MEALLRHRARVDETDSLSQTPLIVAASSGKPDTIRFLLEQRASVEHRAKTSADALECAVVFRRASVVQQLLSGSARPG